MRIHSHEQSDLLKICLFHSIFSTYFSENKHSLIIFFTVYPLVFNCIREGSSSFTTLKSFKNAASVATLQVWASNMVCAGQFSLPDTLIHFLWSSCAKLAEHSAKPAVLGCHRSLLGWWVPCPTAQDIILVTVQPPFPLINTAFRWTLPSSHLTHGWRSLH